MPRIELLNEALINQIAAGEVVERPASVVKELGENALDAGARTIRIHVEGGGITRLRVEDDGMGMSREDCARCLLRHATSKLRTAEDLLAIGTLGFRGEALAAIAAVSRLELTSCEPGAVVGTRIVSEGGATAPAVDMAPVKGTTLDVGDLFFNVPARRKFLRRDLTEVRHVEDAVARLALGNPRVAFFLSVEGAPRLSFPTQASLAERLGTAVGSDVLPHLLELGEERLGMRVHGVMAEPEHTLSTARGVYVFVNGRYVRDRGINSAIQRALAPALAPGRQPVMALFVEVEPNAVDVNVHPQKTEVRFADARGVYEVVHAALSRALAGASEGLTPMDAVAGHAPEYADAVDRFLSRVSSGVGEGELFRTGLDAPLPPAESRQGFFSELIHVGTLGRQFLLMEGQGSRLVVLDAHAALERVHAAAFRRAWDDEASRRRGLSAGTVELTRDACQRLVGWQAPLLRLGVEVEAFGSQSLAVRALPAALLGANLPILMGKLAALLPATPAALDASWDEVGELVRLLACEAAGTDSRDLAAQELRALLQTLDASEPWGRAAHPRVVLLETHLKSGPSPGAG